MVPLQTRRRFIASLGLLAAGGASVAWSRRVEPRWLQVVERDVPLPAHTRELSGETLRVLHLSDIHCSPIVSLEYIAHAIAAGLALKPDIVCLTGDFITVGEPFNDDALAATLAPLAAAVPTFATLGNHDGGPFSLHYGGFSDTRRVSAILKKAGASWLNNDGAQVTIRGRPLQVVGLGDLWNGDCRPERAWAQFSPAKGAAIVALSHNPDSKRFLLPYSWDLLLSGHTHGGQCGIPFLRQRLAPVEDKRFLGGLYRYENRWLNVSKGVGNIYGVRVFCRPQVVLLKLT